MRLPGRFPRNMRAWTSAYSYKTSMDRAAVPHQCRCRPPKNLHGQGHCVAPQLIPAPREPHHGCDNRHHDKAIDYSTPEQCSNGIFELEHAPCARCIGKYRDSRSRSRLLLRSNHTKRRLSDLRSAG